MEGQKIEIEVGNSLAAMAYVVADQQRMFKEKDERIAQLEQKCQNFAKNLVNLEAEYNKALETIKSCEKSMELKEQSIGLYEKELDQLHEELKQKPTWETVEVDESTGIIKAFPKEGKWLVRFVIHEDYKGSYFDAFGISCVSGMTAYIGIDTKEKSPCGIPKCSKAEALYLGEFM